MLPPVVDSDSDSAALPVGIRHLLLDELGILDLP